MPKSPQSFIGIFDSGIGGLSVEREIHALLPDKNLVYVADTRFAPYGDKPSELLEDRIQRIAYRLVEMGAEILVLACNTATAALIDHLRTLLPIPIVGVEPGIKAASNLHQVRKVGVLATSFTLRSNRYQSLKARMPKDIDWIDQPCPGLADRVEQGDLESTTTRDLLNKYLTPLLAQDVDTLVLGCTHYAFLKLQIQRITGKGIRLVDTGQAVALQVARINSNIDLRLPNEGGTRQIFTTGAPKQTYKVLKLLMPQAILPEPFIP